MKQIPTSAMSDIAFLLLMFFIVFAIVSGHIPPSVTPPSAIGEEALLEDLPIIYVDNEGVLFIDDHVVSLESVPYQERYGLLASKNTPFSIISPLIEHLRTKGAVTLICLVASEP